MTGRDRSAGAGDGGAAIRAGSKSFAAASRLFDPATRARVWALYAWCRHCDDAVDGQVLGHGPLTRGTPASVVARLRQQTAQAVAGAADLATPFDGLAKLVGDTALPEAWLVEHLDGFAMDVERRRYQTLDDTLTYCHHVAGVVGLMMAWLMGVRDEDVLARGRDLGLGFQLTNIARDVMDDARAGRVYLPAEWLLARGVPPTPEAVLAPEHRAAVAAVVGRLLDDADRHYASAEHGMRRLPFRSAAAVRAARHVYADIGTIVRRQGAEAWQRRASTSGGRKLALVLRAVAEAARDRVLDSRAWA